MNPDQAAPTPVPLHDIAGPVEFFPYPVWLVVVVALLAVALLVGLVWLARGIMGRTAKPLTNEEKARRALAELRERLVQMGAYTFSIEAGKILAGYIEAARGVRATTQTSVEFLNSIRERADFPEEERQALAYFLERADVIKFARADASVEDCQALLERAEEFLRSAAREAGERVGSGEAAREPEGVR